MPSLTTIRRGRDVRGVTVVEILGLLAAVTMATYLFAERHQAPVADTPQQLQEKCAAAKMFVTAKLDAMLSSYKLQTGRYPVTAEGLWALIEAPPRINGWKGPYLTQPPLPLDPWGQPYHYTFPPIHHGADQYDAWSCGPDQISGTADDINNW